MKVGTVIKMTHGPKGKVDLRREVVHVQSNSISFIDPDLPGADELRQKKKEWVQ